MLDLLRLSRRRIFPPGGPELFRQIALLTEMSGGDEILVVACGNGIGVEYFVREHDVQAQGVDHDPRMVEEAERRARDEHLAPRLQFQHARPDRLPYRDRIFDVVVAELALTAHSEPAPAVRELVRVVKPGGAVVLIQLVWKAPVDGDRQRILSEHLGVRPLMLVEWKRLLREAGVGPLHTEDWSHEETAFRSRTVMPFPDFAELFSLPEKLAIVRRAWRRWGWKGVLTALVREREVHRLLTRERILGLDLLKGARVAPAEEGEATAAADAAAEAPTARETEAVDAAREAQARAPGAAAGERERERADEEARHGDTEETADTEETEGLPLFSEPDDASPRQGEP